MENENGLSVDPHRTPRTFPMFTIGVMIVTLLIFLFRDASNCSMPLGWWILLFVVRHIVKAVLYHVGVARAVNGQIASFRLSLALGFIDLCGPSLWALGGYYIFHADTCDTGVFVYASMLWGLQTIVLLLPCCFLSTIIFCAPCMLWLAPYVIRPNPNTVETSREILARIPQMKYQELLEKSFPESSTSCSICLGDYVESDSVMKLPCGHLFHSGCISEWTRLSQLCPICRDNIVIAMRDDELGDDKDTAIEMVETV